MLEMTGYVTLSEQPPFVTLSEVEWVCHVKRPTGVETSRFLDYARNDSGGVFQNEKAVIFQILQFEGFAWWCKQFGSFHCVS